MVKSFVFSDIQAERDVNSSYQFRAEVLTVDKTIKKSLMLHKLICTQHMNFIQNKANKGPKPLYMPAFYFVREFLSNFGLHPKSPQVVAGSCIRL